MAEAADILARLESMDGKGSKQRPTDKKKFDEGFEKAFGKIKQQERTYKTWNQDNSLDNIGIKKDE